MKNAIHDEGFDVDENPDQGKTPPFQVTKSPQRRLPEVVSPDEKAFHRSVTLHAFCKGV